MQNLNKNGAEFSVPLANAKNKALQNEVLKYREKVSKLLLKIDENQNRIKNLEQNISAEEQNLKQSQALTANIRSQVSKENDAILLAENEEKIVQKERKQLEHFLEQLQQREKLQKSKIERNNQIMKELEAKLSDESSIAAILKSMADEQQNDIDAVNKYSQHDETRIKELEVNLANLRDELNQAERQHVAARLDRQATAINLRNVQQEFNRLVQERNNNLVQWETTIGKIQQRNNQLEYMAAKLEELKRDFLRKKLQQDDTEKNCNQRKMELENLKILIENRQKFASEKKMEFSKLQKDHDDMKSEIDLKENQLRQLIVDSDNRRREIQNARQKIEENRKKIIKEEKKQIKLVETLKEAENKKNSAKNQKEALQKYLEEKEERASLLQNQILIISDSKSTTEKQIKNLKSQIDQIDTQSILYDNSIKNSRKNIRKTEEMLTNLEEQIYNKTMEIIKAQIKLNKISGNAGDLERRQTEKIQIERLKEELSDLTSDLVSLRKEVQSTQSDILGLQRSCDQEQQRKILLINRADQLKIDCSALDRSIVSMKNEIDTLRLQESLCRLEIRKKEKILQNHARFLDDLEKQRANINYLIEERRLELNSQIDLLKSEIRILKENLHKVSIEAKGKAAEIDKIKSRYEMVASTLSLDSGFEEEEPTEAYFIIKMAQEKELLKESISQLCIDNRQIENDNKALKNTLELVASTNQQFRQHAVVGTLTDDEKALRKAMENKKQKLSEKIDFFTKEIKLLENRSKVAMKEIKSLRELEIQLNKESDDYRLINDRLKIDIEDQKKKIDRANYLSEKLKQSLRKMKKTKRKTDEELDFEVSQLKKRLSALRNSLAEIAENHPEMKEIVEKYFLESSLSKFANEKPKEAKTSAKTQINLKIPARGRNSRCSSASSSKFN